MALLWTASTVNVKTECWTKQCGLGGKRGLSEFEVGKDKELNPHLEKTIDNTLNLKKKKKRKKMKYSKTSMMFRDVKVNFLKMS